MATAQDRYLFLDIAPTSDPPSGVTYVYTDGNGILKSRDSAGNVKTYVDEESGTWSPTLIALTTDFDSVAYASANGGSYIKNNGLVHIQGTLRTDGITVGSASGSIAIGNLPFTPKTNESGNDGYATLAISWSSDWTTNPLSARVTQSSNHATLMKRASFGANSETCVVADANTTTTSNLTYFSGTYMTDE